MSQRRKLFSERTDKFLDGLFTVIAIGMGIAGVMLMSAAI